MAKEIQIGGNGSLFVGEDKTIIIEVIDPVTKLPVDISGFTINFVVGKNDRDNTVFNKQATIIGTFNADRVINTQRARIILTDTEMNTVTNRTYRHSWKRMDDGSETVFAYGDFVPERATAP